MTKKIGIENYRVFKKFTEFEIRPITLLIGPNNSGKSSFTKLLRLIDDGVDPLGSDNINYNTEDFKRDLNRDSKSDELRLRVNSNIPFLGNSFYNEYVYKNGRIVEITIGRKNNEILKIQSKYEINYETAFILGGGESGNASINIEELINVFYNKEIYLNVNPPENYYPLDEEYLYDLKKESFLDITDGTYNLTEIMFTDVNTYLGNEKFSFSPEKEYKLVWQAVYNEIDGLEKDYLLFNVYSDGKNVSNHFINQIRQIQNKTCSGLALNFFNPKYELKRLKGDIQENIAEELSNDISDLEVKISRLGELVFDKLLGKYYYDKDFSLFDILIGFKDTISPKYQEKYSYLSTMRGHQARVLQNNSKFELDALIRQYYNNKEDERFEGGQFIDEALKIIGIDGGLNINRPEDFISIVKVNINGEKQNLSELGFGYSQIIPVILFLALNAPDWALLENKKLIIEEPELSLHPNLQSKLGEIFMLALKYFPTSEIIIETHSEYLIRKLQYLTAKGDLETNKIIIHYFNSDKYVSKDEPKVKQIEITSNGNLTDTFGPGFYDEAIKLQFDLLNINKEQNN